jgi:hypothetical protein
MAVSKSNRSYATRSAGLVVVSLGMLFGACKGSGNGKVDGAVDAPQTSTNRSTGAGSTSTGTGGATGTGPGATGTGTGSFSSTNTGPNTGRDNSTNTVVNSSRRTDIETHTATATVTAGASAQTTGDSTSLRTGPFTGTATVIGGSKPTNTVLILSDGTNTAQGVNTSPNTFTKTTTTICYPAERTDAKTGTATGGTTAPSTGTGTSTGVCATWDQITVSRKAAMGFCPQGDTASSAVIKRTGDGSLILTGEAFRAAPGETEGCISAYLLTKCFKRQTIPETRLTPAQRDQLIGLIAAMPPGWCTPMGYCDPCMVTTLTIGDFSDADSVGCCYESSSPGTHMASEHAVVSFIDSLIPGAAPVGVDAAAGDTRRMDSRSDR